MLGMAKDSYKPYYFGLAWPFCREIVFNNIRTCLAQACDLCWLMSALWALNIIIKSSNGATHPSTGRRPVVKIDFPGPCCK